MSRLRVRWRSLPPRGVPVAGAAAVAAGVPLLLCQVLWWKAPGEVVAGVLLGPGLALMVLWAIRRPSS